MGTSISPFKEMLILWNSPFKKIPENFSFLTLFLNRLPAGPASPPASPAPPHPSHPLLVFLTSHILLQHVLQLQHVPLVLRNVLKHVPLFLQHVPLSYKMSCSMFLLSYNMFGNMSLISYIFSFNRSLVLQHVPLVIQQVPLSSCLTTFLALFPMKKFPLPENAKNVHPRCKNMQPLSLQVFR